MSDHALFSPSGAHGWMTCPGKLALEAGYPNTSSSFADEGTAAHSLASWCLEEKLDADAYIGRIIEAGARKFTVDLDMAANVQLYVDAVREYAADGVLMIEQRVAFGQEIGQPDDLAFGTSDAIVITPDGELQVHDLKYGRGVAVSAIENEQMMLYALGAARQVSFLGPFERVRVVIHQVRLGSPSEWDLTWADLVAFGERAKAAATAVTECLGKRAFILAGATIFGRPTLAPSDGACRFCRAKADCPAKARQAAEGIVGEFEDLTEGTVERGLEQLPMLYGDALGARLALVDQIEDWCKAVRDRAHAELAAGRSVTGFKLVEGKLGDRAWSDAAAAEAALKAMRVKHDAMFAYKLISPTAAEKLAKAGTIGERQWPKLQALITRAPGKPSVAPASDQRPALSITPVADDFDDLTATPSAAEAAAEFACSPTATRRK